MNLVKGIQKKADVIVKQRSLTMGEFPNETEMEVFNFVKEGHPKREASVVKRQGKFNVADMVQKKEEYDGNNEMTAIQAVIRIITR